MLETRNEYLFVIDHQQGIATCIKSYVKDFGALIQESDFIIVNVD